MNGTFDSQSNPARCFVEIDLDALDANIAVIRRMTFNRARVMAIVKANAYGHGASEIAMALSGRVEMFGVANLEEGLRIRAAVPDADLFILGTALPWERQEMIKSGFVPCVSSAVETAAYAESARLLGVEQVRVHLAIDTGMGRMGVWQNDALREMNEISAIPGIELAGVATHLPVADEDEAFTLSQLDRFDHLIRKCRAAGVKAPVIHCLNSAGILRFGDRAHDMVRAGLVLYGISPFANQPASVRPVMTFKSRVIQVRELGPGRGVSYGRSFVTSADSTRVATLAVGYADGYPRSLSGRGTSVLIQGQRCPLLGRVTMDQIMVDVSGIPGTVECGDEAVLIGRQGEMEISVMEIAEKAGTIPWEIFTGIKGRVERIYLRREDSQAKS